MKLTFPKLVLSLLATIPTLILIPGVSEAATETAQYRVRFQANWSASTHPVDFPSGREHFSGLIGGVHNASASFWQSGGLASNGIERMAEVGAMSPLDDEIQVAINAGNASQIIRGSGLGTSPANTSTNFSVSQTFPLVTLVSMIAPSPDWFVGVSGYSLFQNGDWVQQSVIQLFAYDAGTDNGSTFLSGDSDSNPPRPIQRIVSGPLGNGVPIGTFTFTRQDTPPGPTLDLQDGRFQVSVTYRDFELNRDDGQPGGFSQDTGYFWFFSETNIEILVKILDACDFNDRYWVFASGLTNVEVEIRVVDTLTGQTNVYNNPLGEAFQPIQDTDAFATCQ